MAILKKNTAKTGLAALRDNLQEILRPASPVFADVSVSAESINNDAYLEHNDKIAVGLQGAFAESMAHLVAGGVQASQESSAVIPGFGVAPSMDGTDCQRLQAAALVANATANAAAANAYHRRAINVSVESAGDGVSVIEPSTNPALGYMSKLDASVSLEAFDNRSLEALRAFSTIFAYSAAIQDEFGEAFFPTVTLSPDSTGLEVSIRRTMVQQEIRHPLTGEAVDWKQRNLLDAITDPSIIINESTRIYPQVIIGNPASEKHFVAASVIAPRETLGANGAKIQTAPLKANVKIDILGAGANDRTNGTPDQTDAIDHAVDVEAVFLRVKTSAGESVVRFDTRSFSQNGFLKSNEGRDRRITLDFPTKDLVLTGETLDYVTGQPAAALAFLNADPYTNVALSLESQFFGEGNLQLGTISVSSGAIGVHRARVVNGPNDFSDITDEATLTEIRAEVEEIEFLGYEVKAYYANTNKRFLGLLLDSVEERVRYVVPLSPPISVQTPITATSTATELAGPMNAQRVTNSINAVTKILENVEVLKNVTGSINYGMGTDDAPAIEGFARLMVRPTLYQDRLNIADVISSASSANRTQDVQAAIVNKIRYGIAHIYTESRLQPAIDSINGTAGERPEVVIGADPKIASYIMVNGDPRLLGLGFSTKVVVTYDARFRGKIYASFVRKATSEVDVLSHGAFAYIPELATQAQIPYNGAQTTVTQIQNRNLHVIMLPVALYIEVDGLEQAAAGQVGLPVAFTN